jgi:uncharacterized protein (TIGR00266 family)
MQHQILGEPMPVVECYLQPGEGMRNEKGSMVWMSHNLQMKTEASGGMGAALGRAISRESIFQNTYWPEGGPGYIAFGSTFVGSIWPVQVTPQMPVIAQKSAFLASELGVQFSVFFQRKVAAGFFGGEGFIMQQFSGQGTVFIEVDGSAVSKTLQAGEEILVDNGNLVMMDASCSMDIRAVSGLKNKLLGGEGFSNTVVRGPGRIVLQTITLPRVAQAIANIMPGRN